MTTDAEQILAEAKKLVEAEKQKRREAFIADVKAVQEKHNGFFTISPSVTVDGKQQVIILDVNI